MHEALELIAVGADDQFGSARARTCTPAKTIAADAKSLDERIEQDGSDAIDAAFLAMHTRELMAAQAEQADRRERLREINGVMEFVQRAATGKARGLGALVESCPTAISTEGGACAVRGSSAAGPECPWRPN